MVLKWPVSFGVSLSGDISLGGYQGDGLMANCSLLRSGDMNKKKVDKLLKMLWKQRKAGMIDDKKYWSRRRSVLKCEENGCSNRAVCTMSIVRKDDGKVIAQFRLCPYHAGVNRKKEIMGLNINMEYDAI